MGKPLGGTWRLLVGGAGCLVELCDPPVDPLELLQARDVVVGIRVDRLVDPEEGVDFRKPAGQAAGERGEDLMRVHSTGTL